MWQLEDPALTDTYRQLESFEPRLGRSVSLEQAAALLHVSRRTIYNRIRDGRLLTIRTLGGSQRVLVESLYGLSLSTTDTPDEPPPIPDAAPASIART
jgi:excisionase family DNA binding protein